MESLLDFGESPYGKRLGFGPVYRDSWAGVLYVVHTMMVTVASVYLWATQKVEVETDSGILSLGIPYVVATFLLCMLGSGLFSLAWLMMMRTNVAPVIKAIFYGTVAASVLVAVTGAVNGDAASVVAGLLVALFVGLYAWCVWGRIPFASALLSISCSITKTYPGTMLVSLAMTIANFLWFVIWCSAFSAYLLSTSGDHSRGLVAFLFVVSLYWGLQVNANVSHTTSCGVAATWYFSQPQQIHRPVSSALKRTLTTSFGSVCLGSLLSAIMQAVQAVLQSSRKRNACCAVAACLLSCVRALVEYFNSYAFAHVAIYGKSFADSGRAAWKLLSSRGIQAIINDDLTGMVICLGAIASMMVSVLVGMLCLLAFDHSGSLNRLYVWVDLVIAGSAAGFFTAAGILSAARSCIVALFVCYAEDPAVLFRNRPHEYHRLSGAKEQWAVVYATYGYPAGGQLQAPSAQPAAEQQPLPPTRQC